MKDIKVGVEKMTRNCRKMIKKTADSLLLSKHSIQFLALFLLLSGATQGRQDRHRGIYRHYGILFLKIQARQCSGLASLTSHRCPAIVAALLLHKCFGPNVLEVEQKNT